MKEKGLIGDCQHLMIARKYEEILRGNNGDIYYNKQKKTEFILPLEWVYKNQPVDLQSYNIKFNQLKDEFVMNGKVVVFTSKQEKDIKHLNGSNGYITGFKDDKKQIRIQVQLVKEPSQINRQDLKSDHVISYSLKYVAEEIRCSTDVLLYVLGSVVVQLNNNYESYYNLVHSFDIGLNIINRHTNQLVPEFARIHHCDQQAEGREKYNQYYNLELSIQCVKLLCEYKKKAPSIFSYLERRVDTLKNLKKLNVSDLYPNAMDPNIQLSQFYIWLMDQHSSKYMLSHAASSVISSNSIAAYEMLTPTLKEEQFTIHVNPGYLATEHYIYIPPFFSDHPPFHKLGDRVVLLNSVNQFPLFGSYGTVVGLIDTGKTFLAEVLWDQPTIGLTDLGGRCSLLRGSLCQFTDIFNLTLDWNSLLCERGVQVKGWQHQVSLYKPEFQQKIISSKEDHQKLISSINADDPFTPFESEEQKNQYQKPKILTKQPLYQQQQVEIQQQQQLIQEPQKISIPDLFKLKQNEPSEQNEETVKVKKILQKKQEADILSIEDLVEKTNSSQLVTNQEIKGKSADEIEKEQQFEVKPPPKVLTRK